MRTTVISERLETREQLWKKVLRVGVELGVRCEVLGVGLGRNVLVSL